MIAFLVATASAAEPSVALTQVYEGQCKGEECDTVGLRLDNASGQAVWFVIGDVSELEARGRYPRWGPRQVRIDVHSEGFRIDDLRFVRVRAHEQADVTERRYDAEPFGVGVAAVAANGRPLEHYLQDLPPTCEPGWSRSMAWPACREAMIAEWNNRITHLTLEWSARWEVRPGGRPAIRKWAAPPKKTWMPEENCWTCMSDTDDAALDTLPQARLATYLDQHWLPVFASTTTRVWQQRGVWVALHGDRRSVRTMGVVYPVDPQHRTIADEGEFWHWRESRTRSEGTPWTDAPPGYVRLRAEGFTRIGTLERVQGLNEAFVPPLTLDSRIEQQAVTVVAGLAPEELIKALLDQASVKSCYDDARFGNARVGLESLNDLFSGPPLLLEPGTDLGFGGYVVVVAEVGADGHVVSAHVDGPTTPRFSSCVAREVPKGWWLAPPTDGRPYRVEVPYLLTPDW